MQTKQLLSVDYHYDSDTSMAKIGEIDFSITTALLEDYIKTYGHEGVKDILATLGHLAWAVKDKYNKAQKPDMGGTSVVA